MPNIIAIQADAPASRYILGITEDRWQMRAEMSEATVRDLTGQDTRLALEGYKNANSNRIIAAAIRKMEQAGKTWQTVDMVEITRADLE